MRIPLLVLALATVCWSAAIDQTEIVDDQEVVAIEPADLTDDVAAAADASSNVPSARTKRTILLLKKIKLGLLGLGVGAAKFGIIGSVLRGGSGGYGSGGGYGRRYGGGSYVGGSYVSGNYGGESYYNGGYSGYNGGFGGSQGAPIFDIQDIGHYGGNNGGHDGGHHGGHDGGHHGGHDGGNHGGHDGGNHGGNDGGGHGGNDGGSHGGSDGGSHGGSDGGSHGGGHSA